MHHHKGEVKVPEMEVKLEDNLSEKLALMLDSEKVTGLGEQRATVKGL